MPHWKGIAGGQALERVFDAALPVGRCQMEMDSSTRARVCVCDGRPFTLSCRAREERLGPHSD